MPRLSIDMTPEEHQKVKALAEQSGQSIEDYIKQQSLSPQTEEQAIHQLKTFLTPRIQEGVHGEFVESSFDQIKKEARDNMTS